MLPLSVPFGLGPQHSDVRADIPLSSITDAQPKHDPVIGCGVNGGVPITLRTLWVSVTAPDVSIEAVAKTP